MELIWLFLHKAHLIIQVLPQFMSVKTFLADIIVLFPFFELYSIVSSPKWVDFTYRKVEVLEKKLVLLEFMNIHLAGLVDLWESEVRISGDVAA